MDIPKSQNQNQIDHIMVDSRHQTDIEHVRRCGLLKRSLSDADEIQANTGHQDLRENKRRRVKKQCSKVRRRKCQKQMDRKKGSYGIDIGYKKEQV